MEEVALMHVATDVPRLRLPLTSLLGMLDLTTNPRDRVYLATAMSTLKRSSELVPLTIDKVDLQGGWLQVYNQKSKIWDSLGIGTELDGELRRWMVDYADAIGRPLNGGDLLFPGAKNRAIIGWEGEPGHKTRVFEPLVWEPDKVMRHSEEIVKRVLQEMGVEDIKGTGTHTVRRSMARVVFDHLSSQDGYTNALRTVSRMLNHRQAATTEIYLGIDEERTRRDELMRGVPFLTNMLPDRSNVVSLHAAK
jgi:integrase